MIDIVNFVYQAVSGGVIGNAAYDAVKKVLGDKATLLFNAKNQPDKFTEILESLIIDEKLKNDLLALSSEKHIMDSLIRNDDIEVTISLGTGGKLIGSINDNKNSKIKIL